jgi:hypothetical protein
MSSTMFISRHVKIYFVVFFLFVSSEQIFREKTNAFATTFARYFCRSLTYDPISKACVLSSEDSASLSDQEVATMTGTGYYYFEILCMGLGKPSVINFHFNDLRLS